MKINDIRNLWIATNTTNDFSAYVCGEDEEEVREIFRSYLNDTKMEGPITVQEYDENINVDCDYILVK